MGRKKFGPVVVAAVALVAAVSCQTGVRMWASCTVGADGDPTGTDGSFVLACRNGRWEPVMTVEEFVRLARGEHVAIAPLPPPPTTTTTTSTTMVPASTVDQERDATLLTGRSFMSCPHDLTRAQTFTAGRSGTLDKVSLVFANGTVAADVTIRPVDAGGGPSSTTIGSGTYTGPATDTFVDIPLTTPAPMAAGTQYAIVIATASGCTGGFSLLFGPDTYSGGARWSTFLSDLSTFVLQSDRDLAFKTWVR